MTYISLFSRFEGQWLVGWGQLWSELGKTHVELYIQLNGPHDMKREEMERVVDEDKVY